MGNGMEAGSKRNTETPLTRREMTERFEATPMALKIIAGLLSLVCTLGVAWGVNVNNKLNTIIEKNAEQDKQISANASALTEREKAFQDVKEDIKDIRIDVRAIYEKIITKK